MVQSKAMPTTPNIAAFEDYWLAAQPRFLAMAKKEWEALADGPVKGTLIVGLHDGAGLNIGTTVEVNGLSEQAVANKLAALLESSYLTGTFDAQDASEWQLFHRSAQRRLRRGDHDFSMGAIVCVDVSIGPSGPSSVA